MQGTKAVLIMVGQQSAIAPVNLEAGASKEVADFETSGVDDAVDLVLDAVGDDTFPGDSLHTLGLADIDQRHVRAVECGQVFVVEGWPLAEHTVPGLQSLSNLLVLNDLVHPRTNRVHLAEVRQLSA